MLARLGKAELALSEEDALKRAPRGFDTVDDAAIVAAARQRHFITLRPVPETAIREPALADALCAFAHDALPLLEWGWDALAEFALNRVEHTFASADPHPAAIGVCDPPGGGDSLPPPGEGCAKSSGEGIPRTESTRSRRAMAKVLPSIDAACRAFIGRQRIFFAASAAPGATSTSRRAGRTCSPSSTT